MSSGHIWRFSCRALLLSSYSMVSLAQNTDTKAPPVIDVHVYAMDLPGLAPMCPKTAKFTASDPKDKEEPFGWAKEPCTPALYPSASGEYMEDVLAEMERLNVTAVVFGDPTTVQKWKDAAPARVIPGTSFQNGMTPGQRVPLEELRKDFTSGGFKVMGEIGLQYEGISPSDPSVDAYFALAEELDIPVAVHMGTGGSGRANVTMPKFRGSMGNPLLFEELLAPPETACSSDARRLSDDRRDAYAAAGELPRLRGRCRTDLELSHQGSQSLYRATGRCRVRGQGNVRNRSTALAQVDGLFDQHHPERGLPDAPTEARHSVQQRRTIPEVGYCSRKVSGLMC